MDIPRLGNGRIDWDTILRRYGADMDMSYARTLKWASERSSLQAVAELVGFSITGGGFGQRMNDTSREILNSLGAFLDSKGYKVPRMNEIGQDTFKPIEDVKEDEKMPTNITKEEYLDMRLGGMNRTEVCKKIGVSPPTFYGLLFQWGIKDSKVEEQVLSAMREGEQAKDKFAFEVSVKAEPVQQTIEKSEPSDAKYVTVKIPVEVAEWPEGITREFGATVDRDTLIRVGIVCLQNAAAWARRDLVDILGESVTNEPVQAFMERKCQVDRGMLV